MATKKTSTNTTPKSQYVPIRWPHDLLEESKAIAKEHGTSWADFVRTATIEKIQKIKSEPDTSSKV